MTTKKTGHPNWVKGVSGNPAGKPKGARNKLGEAFIEELHQDFLAHGSQVIAEVRITKPDVYLKVIASLMPRQLEIKEGAFDNLGDDELAALVAAARSALGVAPGGGSREETTVKPESLN